MAALLYAEINFLCICVLLVIYWNVQWKSFQQMAHILLSRVLRFTIAYFVLDILWVFVSAAEPTPAVILANKLINVVQYPLLALTSYLWFTYSENLQASPLTATVARRHCWGLPVALMAVLALVSLRTGWLFSVDAENVYRRGPLYILNVMVSYGYMVLGSGRALWRSWQTDSIAEQARYRTLARFVIAPAGLSILQMLLPSHPPTICAGITLGILYAFISLQNQQISQDPLTGLNNRARLWQYLSARMHAFLGFAPLYLVMIDMDQLKSINDLYGHVEGDHALRLVADAMRASAGRQGYFLARYGGDEFTLVCEPPSGMDICTVCDNLQWSVARQAQEAHLPYPLSVSFGYAKYDPGEHYNVETFIHAADLQLYEMKKSSHGEHMDT